MSKQAETVMREGETLEEYAFRLAAAIADEEPPVKFCDDCEPNAIAIFVAMITMADDEVFRDRVKEFGEGDDALGVIKMFDAYIADTVGRARLMRAMLLHYGRERIDAERNAN